jgi:hypothetical protein
MRRTFWQLKAGSYTPPLPPLQLTVAQYVKHAFGFSFDDRWYFVLSTFLFAVVYRLLAILATRYVGYAPCTAHDCVHDDVW